MFLFFNHKPCSLTGVCAVDVTQLAEAEAIASWWVNITIHSHYRAAGGHLKHLTHLHVHFKVGDRAPKLWSCIENRVNCVMDWDWKIEMHFTSMGCIPHPFTCTLHIISVSLSLNMYLWEDCANRRRCVHGKRLCILFDLLRWNIYSFCVLCLSRSGINKAQMADDFYEWVYIGKHRFSSVISKTVVVNRNIIKCRPISLKTNF